MRRLVSENIETLRPYTPGKPIEETERELGITNIIKLASNENSLGPSKKAIRAIRNALKNLHLYPDANCYYLKEKLAEYHKISPDQLILGNGSNDIIDLSVRTFCSPGDEVITSEMSFIMFYISAQAQNCVQKIVKMKNYTFDLDAIKAEITDKTKMIYIANPNNPTGTYNTKKEMDRFIKGIPEDIVVGIDEAYYEYVTARDYPFNTIDYIKDRPSTIIMRTFSKIYGLAGVRIGYGITDAKLANYMNRVRQPFNISTLAQVAAIAALDDKAHIRKTRKMNREGMDYLTKELTSLGFTVIPSQTNFLLIDLHKDATELYEKILRLGVIVRPMKGFNMPTGIRVTVGTMEENKRFIEALKESL
ncbi:MAG: histidinol-phosphate transaminase [Myxococcota bacterium]